MTWPRVSSRVATGGSTGGMEPCRSGWINYRQSDHGYKILIQTWNGNLFPCLVYLPQPWNRGPFFLSSGQFCIGVDRLKLNLRCGGKLRSWCQAYILLWVSLNFFSSFEGFSVECVGCSPVLFFFSHYKGEITQLEELLYLLAPGSLRIPTFVLLWVITS